MVILSRYVGALKRLLFPRANTLEDKLKYARLDLFKSLSPNFVNVKVSRFVDVGCFSIKSDMKNTVNAIDNLIKRQEWDSVINVGNIDINDDYVVATIYQFLDAKYIIVFWVSYQEYMLIDHALLFRYLSEIEVKALFNNNNAQLLKWQEIS